MHVTSPLGERMGEAKSACHNGKNGKAKGVGVGGGGKKGGKGKVCKV